MIHRRLLRVLFFCFALCLGFAAHAANLFRGMTEQELIETLGPPVSEMGRQSKKILMFANGSAELRLGRVNSVEGLKMDYMAPDGTSQFVFSMTSGWTLNGEPVSKDFRFTAAPENAPPPPSTGVTIYRPGEENETPPPTGVKIYRPGEENNVPIAPPPASPAREPVAMPKPVGVPIATPLVVPVAAEEVVAMDDTEYDEDEYDEEWDNWDYEDEEYEEMTTSELLMETLVIFVIEFILTLAVMYVSFSHKGFPILMGQLVVLSLLMSLFSAILEFTLIYFEFDIGYLQQVINLGALTGLILLVTDVTNPSTAFSIALISRVATIVVLLVIFLAFASLLAAFS